LCKGPVPRILRVYGGSHESAQDQRYRLRRPRGRPHHARFEGLWPIPHGVTLNSYVVKGAKTALIDLAKDWAGSIDQFESQLASVGVSFESIDYLVLNHLEPDHTAFILELRRRNPRVEILSTPKGIALVRNFFKITEGLREVKTGDTLDLGAGKVLEFFETPNIHWPETMMSFDRADGILFSCDGFGSYGALGERVFDDEFSADEHAFYEGESLRYYANIVASFSSFVTKALDKLGSLPVKVVAPSHGIVCERTRSRSCAATRVTPGTTPARRASGRYA
jgi:flavorubredoxin